MVGEGREAAFAAAEQTRHEWHHILDELRGGLSVEELRARVRANSTVGALRVLKAVEAMPHTGGKVASRALLDGLELEHRTPLSELTDAQWHALVGEMP